MRRRNGSETAEAVAELLGRGLSDYEISRRTGASRSSVQRWRTRGMPARGRSHRPLSWRPSDQPAYAYLLGVYLGDGYISKATEFPVLEIALDSRYPGIAEECSKAIWRTAGVVAKTYRRRGGRGHSIRVSASGYFWPLAFPQHGTGRKHERPIVLTAWQQEIVDRFPKPFVRGLIHSDGSRTINSFRVQLATETREYAYVRYFFTNLSTDIRSLFCESCDSLGIRWTQSSAKNISIANRQSVALLDSFVGSKLDAGGGT